MTTPGNTAKLGATHSNIQTAQRGPSLYGWERTYYAFVSTPLSQRISTLCQPGITQITISPTLLRVANSYRILKRIEIKDSFIEQAEEL